MSSFVFLGLFFNIFTVKIAKLIKLFLKIKDCFFLV